MQSRIDSPPRLLYREDFVIAMRRGHRFAEEPTLARYCEMQHLLVSVTGDADGYVDVELAKLGLSRRVVMTMPNFMMALPVIAESEMISALPERLVSAYADRFDIVAVTAPLALRRFDIRLIAPKVALMDAGLAWLFDVVERTVAEASPL
jgi:DNA-binding transcriptional LysR family regulator